MEQDPDSPPTIWFQPPIATARHRRVPPIDPVFLIILFPILALLFIFFFLPPFLSHTAHILKPASVKSTWDSLNIFLVLFAILCGVLARRNDDVSSSGDGSGFVAESMNHNDGVQLSGQWIGSSNRKSGSGGLRRNSSSYPNLRQQSVWEINGENQNRFFDDFDLDMNLTLSPVSRYYNSLSRRMETERERERERERGDFYRSPPVSGDIHRESRRSDADRVEFGDVKEIVVDTFEVIPEVREQSPAATTTTMTTTVPPPPPPPPSKRHSFRSVGKNVREIESDELDKSSFYPPPSPPPPPPPPPPPLRPSTEVKLRRSHHKHKKLERKVSDATKEIATALTSLYNQRKTKNKRKLRNSSGGSDSSPPSSVHSVGSPENDEPRLTLAPPPPPPPPPPPFRFHNLFKKGGKHKRIHSVPVITSPTTVPPPPPPPPPSSIFNNIFKSGGRSKRFQLPSNAPPTPPPLPPSSIMNSLFKTGTKSKRFNSIKAASSPPPPPPPPPPMTPPRYTVPVKPKQLSKRTTQAQPKSEPYIRRSSSKGKPPLPAKSSSYFDREDFLPSDSQSPLIPMPPPPPPPFSVPAMKFELRGDFVRVRSTHSSVCSSPDRESVDLTSTIVDGGDSNGSGSGYGPIFFPSPDVNAKADSFISRLKDEWRMDQISYVNEKLG